MKRLPGLFEPFCALREEYSEAVLAQDRVQEEAKRSAVLINQLLSFATVTGGLLTVVAQTNAVGEIKSWAATWGRLLSPFVPSGRIKSVYLCRVK